MHGLGLLFWMTHDSKNLLFFLIAVSHLFNNIYNINYIRLKIIKLCGSYFLRYYASVICRLSLNPIILECCQILSVYKRI